FDPAAGHVVKSEDRIDARIDVEHQPLQVSPNQIGAFLCRHMYFVDQKNRYTGRTADATDGFLTSIAGVLAIELAIVIGIKPQFESHAASEDADMCPRIEQKIDARDLTVMQKLCGEKGNIGPGGRRIAKGRYVRFREVLSPI